MQAIKPKILIVDDTPSIVKAIDTSLRKIGYATLSAFDGEDALEQLRFNSDIGVVLSDWDMPRLDGMGLIRRVREEQPQRRVPVIIMTGRDLTFEDAQNALYGGAYSLLPKPFKLEELQVIIDKAAGLHEQPRADWLPRAQPYFLPR